MLSASAAAALAGTRAEAPRSSTKWKVDSADLNYLTVDVWALGCVVLQMITATNELR